MRLARAFPSEKSQEHDLESQRLHSSFRYSANRIGPAPKDRYLPRRSIYLSPSGNARFDVVPRVVVRNILFKLLDQLRPFGTRPHQTHISFQHIPELRNFIYIPLSS